MADQPAFAEADKILTYLELPMVVEAISAGAEFPEFPESTSRHAASTIGKQYTHEDVALITRKLGNSDVQLNGYPILY